MSSDEKERIAQCLQRRGELLCAGVEDSHLSTLRELERELRQLLKPGVDDQVRAPAFLVCVWIEKYYANLSGVFPSEISEQVSEIRGRLIKERAGPLFQTMGKGFAEDEANVVMETCFRLLMTFLDSVEETRVVAEEACDG